MTGCKIENNWFYPAEIAHVLDGVDFPEKTKEEIPACSWEWVRCVVPSYTNWKRYLACVRIAIVCVIAEFRGDLIDISASDNVLGVSVETLVDDVLSGAAGHAHMLRELRSFLVLTCNKTGKKSRKQELFDKYVEAVASSPRSWFRMRCCDAMARFWMAASLACNDMDTVWFDEEQWMILSELANVLYDAVGFYKHRAEGEINTTFAYVPSNLRTRAFHKAREVLFALETTWLSNGNQEHLPVTNYVRLVGGPIKMTMRRYRFVEEGLTVGKAETTDVMKQTSKNYKLWNRMGAAGARDYEGAKWYRDLLARESELLFPGCAEMLERDNRKCRKCAYSETYGIDVDETFGGVQLCDDCKEDWGKYVLDLPARAAKAFPELVPVLGSQLKGDGAAVVAC